MSIERNQTLWALAYPYWVVGKVAALVIVSVLFLVVDRWVRAGDRRSDRRAYATLRAR
ncbi:MAG TPA: hypothetical protein V6C88_18400 [Chroococcidiopsis sp.]